MGSYRHRDYKTNPIIMKAQPTWDELYDYVDSSATKGDSVAQYIITSHGYNATYDLLYDFVDTKMVEGDDMARKLITDNVQ
jgi:hypothetical protein